MSVTRVHAMPSPTSLSPSFNPFPTNSPRIWSFFVLLPCLQEVAVETWLSNGLIVRKLVVETWSWVIFFRKDSVVETRS